MLTIRKMERGVKQTGAEMRRLAVQYSGDMAPYATKTLPEIFDMLKNLPYRLDPKGLEFVQRPYYTLRGLGRGGDCDDKAICVGAWAYLNNLPFRFVAVGKSLKKPLHHVVTDIRIDGRWVHVDPTYRYNTLGRALGEYPKHVVIG